jgi:hypothetical protein
LWGVVPRGVVRPRGRSVPAGTNTAPEGYPPLATCSECCITWRPRWRTSRERYPWWTIIHILHSPSIMPAARGRRYAAGSVEVPHTTMGTWSHLVALRCHQKLRTAAPRRRYRLCLCLLRRRKLCPSQQESSSQRRRSTPPSLPEEHAAVAVSIPAPI